MGNEGIGNILELRRQY